MKIEKVRVVKGKSYLEAKNEVLHSEKSPENTQNRPNNQSSSGYRDALVDEQPRRGKPNSVQIVTEQKESTTTSCQTDDFTQFDEKKFFDKLEDCLMQIIAKIAPQTSPSTLRQAVTEALRDHYPEASILTKDRGQIRNRENSSTTSLDLSDLSNILSDQEENSEISQLERNTKKNPLHSEFLLVNSKKEGKQRKSKKSKQGN